ncbi:MAG: LamG domain-containing protein, partial [Verrucomicrobiota bacterium]
MRTMSSYFPKWRCGAGFALITCVTMTWWMTRDAAAACMPVPPGLIGWWAGETNPNDVLGLNNGSVQGGTTFAAGEVGQAFVFDGTNGYAQVPDATALSPQVGQVGEMTLDAWVFMARLPQFDGPTGQANRAVVVKGSPGNWEYGFEIMTNGAPFFGVWQSGGNGYTSVSSTNSLSLGTWHHLAGTMRKGVFCRLYVDGQLVAESTSFSGDTTDGAAPLYFGRRGDGQYFDGAVDEVSLYGRALSSSEVNALFGAGTAGK